MEHLGSRAAEWGAAGKASALVRPATQADAAIIHRLYEETPDYFRVISIPMPTLAEVAQELAAAAIDPRRRVELVLSDDPALHGVPDPVSGGSAVGYLDYKLEYPEPGDVMVNLLLILGRLQSHGLGERCVRDLERRLSGRAQRLLASIYGQNPRAERFWQALGFSFAIDAKPVLDWYAKPLAL
jgi:GNAT superfamily N-acetyltransferase